MRGFYLNRIKELEVVLDRYATLRYIDLRYRFTIETYLLNIKLLDTFSEQTKDDFRYVPRHK